MQVKVSVIIPNYNGEAYLEQCLDSLMQQDVRSFEIIVVDDASADDAMEKVKKKYPENGAFPLTRFIEHENNLGFCQSVNDGIDAAKADYVLLLNNDTIAEPNFVREMYRAIVKSEKIFSASAKMVTMDNPDIMDDAGDYYCALGWAFAPVKDKPAQNYTRKKKVFSACAGAAIYRKEPLCRLGKFDENHFAYLEDVDVGYRAKLHGYVNVFAPAAVVRHVGSGVSGSRHNEFKASLSSKNSIYLIYKNMPNWQIALNFPLLFAGFVIKILFYIFKGMGNTYIKGLMEGFRLSKSDLGKAKRQDFQKIDKKQLWKIQGELIWNTIYRVFP